MPKIPHEITQSGLYELAFSSVRHYSYQHYPEIIKEENVLNITDLLLGQENQSAVGQLAKKLGVSEEQARQIVAEVTPSLSRGMQRHADDKGSFGGLMDALGNGNHARYVEKPDLLGHQETVEDGNSILGHIFGNKEVSRNVAKNAEQNTGIASTLIKKALPVIATMVMGTLGKQIFGGGGGSSPASAASQGGGLLTSLLDSDRDGSVIDDVLGMAFKMAFR
uniref:DUF937 domain-containing protein n=1 Tax=uncultured Thiotrichaceae bacterium TaxID=298394 RepID=A0A6S6SAR9_9GAMM|nr:MAG: Unknown protein [uncultured Thiotrichaceae bacterium]